MTTRSDRVAPLWIDTYYLTRMRSLAVCHVVHYKFSCIYRLLVGISGHLHKQEWRVYGHHEWFPAASINFTGVKFFTGEEIVGHLWFEWPSMAAANAFQATTDDLTNKQTNEQTNRTTSPSRNVPLLRRGLNK